MTRVALYVKIACEPLGTGFKIIHLVSARLEEGGIVMYAIVETGGKQYRVKEGDVLSVEKLNAEQGAKVNLKVLAVKKDGSLVVGKPYLENASVEASILEHGKGEKIIVFKYKAKKNYRRKQGHRQPYTKIKIDKIVF